MNSPPYLLKINIKYATPELLLSNLPIRANIKNSPEVLWMILWSESIYLRKWRICCANNISLSNPIAKWFDLRKNAGYASLFFVSAINFLSSLNQESDIANHRKEIKAIATRSSIGTGGVRSKIQPQDIINIAIPPKLIGELKIKQNHRFPIDGLYPSSSLSISFLHG